MALDNAKNFAKVLVNGIFGNGATEITLAPGETAKLPAAPFNLTWWNASDFPSPADDTNVEIVRCTAVDTDTDTLTVIRGQEGTADGTHNLPGRTYRMIAGFTAKLITDIPNQILTYGDHDPITDPEDEDFTQSFFFINNLTGYLWVKKSDNLYYATIQVA